MDGNLALSYQTDHATVFARAARFRAPQTTELYRLQSGQVTADLDSETIDSVEFGVRGQQGAFAYDLAAYWMAKENVIFQDRDRYNVSGADTLHRGIDVTFSWALSDIWSLRGNGAYARHRYDSDIELIGSRGTIEGNDIDTAPKHFGRCSCLLISAPRSGNPCRTGVAVGCQVLVRPQ